MYLHCKRALLWVIVGDEGIMGVSKPTKMTIRDLLQKELRNNGCSRVLVSEIQQLKTLMQG